MQRLIIMAGMVLMLAACGTTEVPEPIGIGTGLDELKQSPCACVEIPQDYSDWQTRS